MKQFQLSTLAILFAFAATAQSFFNTLPKLKEPAHAGRSIAFGPVVTASDSTFCAFRPIVTVAMGIVDGTTKAMGGTGISYQNLTYNYATGKYYCNYSISLLALAGGAVAPTTPLQVISGGILLGIKNNDIGIGLFMSGKKDPVLQKTKYFVGPMFTYNINFNN